MYKYFFSLCSLVFLGGITGSCGVIFLRNNQTVFQIGYHFLFSEPLYKGSPIFLQFCQYLVPDLFALVIIMGMKWYFIVFLINIFLMANESCLNYFANAMTKHHDQGN